MPYDWSHLSYEFLERLNSVKAKRARIVIDHILQHGQITTEELKTLYGYDHPPRAIQDVRDNGIPLKRLTVKSSSNRSIAAYTFDTSATIEGDKVGGRTAFPKQFKDKLYAASSGRCALCNGQFEARMLQIDHRVPYEIAGDVAPAKPGTIGYMLVCGSCNRTKSWSCEHCHNWSKKDQALCLSCYWAYPTDYEHIALQQMRRADIVWQGNESDQYDEIRAAANRENLTVPQYIKSVLKNLIRRATRLFFT